MHSFARQDQTRTRQNIQARSERNLSQPCTNMFHLLWYLPCMSFFFISQHMSLTKGRTLVTFRCYNGRQKHKHAFIASVMWRGCGGGPIFRHKLSPPYNMTWQSHPSNLSTPATAIIFCGSAFKWPHQLNLSRVALVSFNVVEKEFFKGCMLWCRSAFFNVEEQEVTFM